MILVDADHTAIGWLISSGVNRNISPKVICSENSRIFIIYRVDPDHGYDCTAKRKTNHGFHELHGLIHWGKSV